jgi:single-strand DNA-binding protein
MVRKQNPEQSVAEVVTDSTPAKPRSFGTARFTVLGRIASEVTLRYTPTGKAILHLTVAATQAGVVTFVDVTAWERAAEILAMYGAKGREVYVDGRIGVRVREVEGHRIKQLDLVVESFQLLGGAVSARSERLEGAEEGAA